MTERKIEYPAKTTFKAIFRPHDDTIGELKDVLEKKYLDEISITNKQSRTGKFISYTITAVFPSKEILNQTCDSITMIKGFMSLF